ncbi:hypothetical protein MUK42_10884, partial [Musa troglodytarum]
LHRPRPLGRLHHLARPPPLETRLLPPGRLHRPVQLHRRHQPPHRHHAGHRVLAQPQRPHRHLLRQARRLRRVPGTTDHRLHGAPHRLPGPQRRRDQDNNAGLLLVDINVEGRLRWKVGTWTSGHYHIHVTCPAFVGIDHGSGSNGDAPSFHFQHATWCSVEV